MNNFTSAFTRIALDRQVITMFIVVGTVYFILYPAPLAIVLLIKDYLSAVTFGTVVQLTVDSILYS